MKRPSSPAPDIDRVMRLGFDVDVALTLAPLRHGRLDPTIRFEPGDIIWRATRTVEGPASVRMAPAVDGWRVTAWGTGAKRAVAALPRLLGAEDDPSALVLPAGWLRDLGRRLKGLRLGRSDAVLASLVPAIIEQKVTGGGAQRSYRALVLRYGEIAPGPGGLTLPPAADRLAAIPYHALHPLGIEQRRWLTVVRAAGRAGWLEEAVALPPSDALARLSSVRGVGPWTAAETARGAFGDPDAVSVGDFHLPDLVCWALAGEPRGDDARMLELLEPYRGQRARLVRLLELSGIRPPRYGPRYRARSIATI